MAIKYIKFVALLSRCCFNIPTICVCVGLIRKEMRLLFLGTASCFPTPSRGVSCIALQWRKSGEVWLFDCGEGSQVQLQKSALRPGKVTKIFVTHLHGDHVFGLPGLLCTLGNGAEDGKVIDLYGPLGLRKLVATCLELSQSPLPYKCRIHEMVPRLDQFATDEDPGLERYRDVAVSARFPWSAGLGDDDCAEEIQFDDRLGGWSLLCGEGQPTVVAGAIVHRVPSFAFVVQERDSPGALDMERVRAAGLKPGPKLARLKAGQSVMSDAGEREVHPEEVLGPPRRGRRLAVLGDTSDAGEVSGLCRNADLLVHEATMENALKEKASEYGHSTPDEAAAFAARVRARRLCLTHLSPRYRPISEGDNREEREGDGKSARIILDEAKAYLASKGHDDMEVMVAEDFYELTL